MLAEEKAMRLRKAVITAAGYGTRQFPATKVLQKELLPVVDVDGVTKPALHLIVAEALSAGVGEVCIVVRPGMDELLRRYFRPIEQDAAAAFRDKPWAWEQSRILGEMGEVISFAYQEEQEGYGHAVYCARRWVGDEPFLLMLGDHLYLSEASESCARQVVSVFERHQANVSSVAVTPAEQLHLFGTVRGKPLEAGVYEVERLVEKPPREVAERELVTPGLPPGHFLCFFGMHVFTPSIFDALERLIREGIRERGEVQLTTAQEMLRKQERYVACIPRGSRHDIGTPEGYLEAMMSLAMKGPYRQRLREKLAQVDEGLR